LLIDRTVETASREKGEMVRGLLNDDPIGLEKKNTSTGNSMVSVSSARGADEHAATTYTLWRANEQWWPSLIASYIR